jgi:hypothetical protein
MVFYNGLWTLTSCRRWERLGGGLEGAEDELARVAVISFMDAFLAT